MPSLKSIRTRIASTTATQKITRAMKLMAAAQLRRAQDAIVAARPYARSLSEMLAQIAARAGDDAHALLAEREMRRIVIVPLTSDRGLCGGFNTNVGRATLRFVAERAQDERDVSLDVVGRKGRDYFRRRHVAIRNELPAANAKNATERAVQLATALVHDFVENRVDAVFLVYNEFKSAGSQRVVVEQLLPVRRATLPAAAGVIDFIYEPAKQELLDRLVPLYVESELLRALLESAASELGARMTAMENATSNAEEMIAKLTLQYNRARQATITKELMEIVGGAEALKAG